MGRIGIQALSGSQMAAGDSFAIFGPSSDAGDVEIDVPVMVEIRARLPVFLSPCVSGGRVLGGAGRLRADR